MKFIVVLMVALVPLCVRAGGSEVVVIYNSRVPESKGVAEHYAEMRLVPQQQIFGFDLTTNEEMSRAEFRDSLQMPLLKKLTDDQLWKFGDITIPATNGQPEHVESRVVESKIRYAVLCYGVPLKIASDPGVLEPAVAEKMPPELRRNEAAVDSELTWLPLAKMDFPLTGPFPNWLYGATNAALLDPTNGILLVARLDRPERRDCEQPRGQGDAGRARRPVGARLFRRARAGQIGHELYSGRRMDSRRGGNFGRARI